MSIFEKKRAEENQKHKENEIIAKKKKKHVAKPRKANHNTRNKNAVKGQPWVQKAKKF